VFFVFLEIIKLYSQTLGRGMGLWSSDLFNNFIFATFCFSVFAFFKFEIEYKKVESYTDLLWKSLVTSSISLVVLIICRMTTYYLNNDIEESQNEWLENTLYHLNITLLVIMLCNTFFIFKKLSLYLKTKFIDSFWRYLGWGISASTLLGIFELKFNNPIFIFIFGSFSLALIFASFHIKWVAFFNYKQKLFSMINLFIILIISLTFLEYFYEKSQTVVLIFDVMNNVFIMSLLTFSITYPLFSVLVLLFNLPTSSVFENKLREVKNFQILSQESHTAKNEKDIFETLLVGCFSASNASSAALMISENSNIKFFENIGKEFQKSDIIELKSILRKNSYKPDSGTLYITNFLDLNYTEPLKKFKIKSLLWIPLKTNNEAIGYLIICSEVKDGFEKDGIEIIETYASQASLSIRYSRLIEDKIKNERFRAALNIAEKVQKSLLPKELPLNDYFEISTFYKTAEEVGGDYYDYHKISADEHLFVIADVSGKGTSAAFFTAQLKGVFLSLINFKIDIKEMAIKMNEILSECLEKKTFITLSLIYINTKDKQFSHIRAGHCPLLLFDNNSNESKYIYNNGFGLGIVKKEKFDKFIELDVRKYSENDVLLLYTDGLVEAKNEKNEEFGYDLLNHSFKNNVYSSVADIVKNLTSELYGFTKTKTLQDDCTIIAIKFKK
jgi:phosphoserine phosphatase RsbU/P